MLVSTRWFQRMYIDAYSGTLRSWIASVEQAAVNGGQAELIIFIPRCPFHKSNSILLDFYIVNLKIWHVKGTAAHIYLIYLGLSFSSWTLSNRDPSFIRLDWSQMFHCISKSSNSKSRLKEIDVQWKRAYSLQPS